MKEKEILTGDQELALKLIMAGDNVYISGPGGTGKSYLIREAIKRLVDNGKKVLICAPTAVAARNVDGLTIHHTFPFPAKDPPLTESGKDIMARTTRAIRLADAIIIDEISMCRMDLFDAVIKSLKKADVYREKEKLNNIQIIVVGDFYQLPPVLENRDRETLNSFYKAEVGGAYAFQGKGWKQCCFKNVELHTVMRQKDPEFVENLMKLRSGDASCLDYFNANALSCESPDAVSLYPKKSQVHIRNTQKVKEIPGTEYALRAIYSGEASIQDISTVEAELRIKIGTKVMFVTNNITNKYGALIDVERKEILPKFDLYYNGSIGTVVYIDQDEIVVSLQGKLIDIIRQDFMVYGYDNDGNKVVKGYYKQYPIVPAYAMTIHKAQGMTYNAVNVDPDCFAPGQLYVALSRCRDIQHLYLMRPLHSKDLYINNAVKEFYDSLIIG